MPKSLVIFDFCDTIVRSQSADEYVKYALSKLGRLDSSRIEFVRRVMNKYKITNALNKIFPKLNLNKRILLFQLRGVSCQTLEKIADSFCDEVLNKKLNSKVTEFLRHHQEGGDEVIVISGGYDIYLTRYMARFGVKDVLCSRLKFDSLGKFSGFMNGADCLKDEKVTRLLKFVDLNIFSSISCYTDSETDLPVLRYCDKAYIVSYGKKTNWAHKYGFEELVI